MKMHKVFKIFDNGHGEGDEIFNLDEGERLLKHLNRNIELGEKLQFTIEEITDFEWRKSLAHGDLIGGHIDELPEEFR